MKKGIFIQANNKQLLGAKIAKFAMETYGKAEEHNIPVTIMNVEEYPWYTAYEGMEYKRGEETRVHTKDDLQFFTLSRFHPPKLMNYEGQAIVIDPDIFALKNIEGLFSLLTDAPIAACKKKDAWDTSVMILNCEQLKHWDLEKILEGLQNGAEDYRNWMQLKSENVQEIPRTWNSLDILNEETNMLHTTHRLTQPWKTGLPIDFTPGTPPKLFGLIPREPLLRLRGKWPTHYLAHPDKNIEDFFLSLTKEALNQGAITKEEIEKEIENNNIRKDLFHVINQ